MGVWEQISVLAGSPSIAPIWTEAMRQRKLSPKRLLPHSTRAPLSTETQRQLTEHKAPRHELLCKPDSSFYSASTIGAVPVEIGESRVQIVRQAQLPLIL